MDGSTIVESEKSTHKVETFLLKEMSRHPNADTLSIIKIEGTDYTYVAKTEEWAPHIGKIVAWIPPDSVVKTERKEFSFLGNKSRVKAKKIRGIVSYGLLVIAPDGVVVGEDAAKILEVSHYEPEIKGQPKPYAVGSDVASAPPGVYFKYDVDAFLKYGRKVFTPGEPIYVTEKIHGANGRYVFLGGQMHCSSRTEWKKEFTTPPNLTLADLLTKISDPAKAQTVYEKAVLNFKPRKNMWWLALERTPQLREYCESHPGHTVYGEVYGNVQDMKYGLGADVAFAAFDVLKPDGIWMDSDEFVQQNLPKVPFIGVKDFDFDKLVALAEGESLVPGANHFREGVVVKPIKERWDSSLGRVSLKIINPAYLERA